MAELHSLESLQALHADLLALSESRLSNVERLGIQLEAHIQDFRALLDKRARSEESRKSLETGIVESYVQYGGAKADMKCFREAECRRWLLDQ
jgi:hypothetical protein